MLRGNLTACRVLAVPKPVQTPGVWEQFVVSSVRSQAKLRKALKRTIQLARNRNAEQHLRVVVIGPPASGKSSLIAIVRRLEASCGLPRDGLEVYEDAVGSPSAARVAWQVVPGTAEQAKEITARMRIALSHRTGPKAELVVILTKVPPEIVPEISDRVKLIDVLSWATQG